MAASGSLAAFGDAHVDDLFTPVAGFTPKPATVSFNYRKFKPGNLKSTIRFARGYSAAGSVLSNASRGGTNYFGLGKLQLIDMVVYSSRRSFSAYSSARDVGNYQEEQHMTLKLRSGACYLPHPDKESYGGEDAHFICEDQQVIGVADGVGGWAEVGINAGDFARELMSHSVSAIEEQNETDPIDPARVLEKAHSLTRSKGSSTACIVALTKEGIHAINLGDSGFIVIREGSTIFQSPVQQHSFNFTYQLESGTTGDLPSSGQVFRIKTAPGDVIVAGTDGLFDNLYNREVTAVVVDACRAGLEPREAAENIAGLARKKAVNRNIQTPFSVAAQEAGFRYYGGKLDDITVVVSYITT